MGKVIRFPIEDRLGSPAREQPAGTVVILPPRGTPAIPIEPDDGYPLQALCDVLEKAGDSEP